MLQSTIKQKVSGIEKISEVKEVQLLVTASRRDDFQGTVTQHGMLPHVFSYGVQRNMSHYCSHLPANSKR